MAPDAFETRLSFIQSLQKLNATVQSQQKCAQFALKNKDLDEDLFNCILEELDKANLNVKVNILYFLETLCETSVTSGFHGYRNMLQRYLSRIALAVAPVDQGSTAALTNVGPVRSVFHSLVAKAYISQEQLDAALGPFAAVGSENTPLPRNDLTSEEILRRIEEDRERHKRLRENIWVVAPRTDDIKNPEFESMWETTSELNADDQEKIREDLAIQQACT